MGENLHESSLEGKVKIKFDSNGFTFFQLPDPNYVRTIVIDGVEIRIKGRKEDASIIQQYLESIFEVAIGDR